MPRGSRRSVSPDVVVSNGDENGVRNAVSDTPMDTLSALRIFHTKTRIRAVLPAADYWESVLLMDAEQLSAICREVVDLQGLSILVFSLDRIKGSYAVTSALLGILCEVTCNDDRSGKIMVDLGAVNEILSIAKGSPDHAKISERAISILLNLNINEDSLDAVIGDDVIDYCKDVTKRFPDNMTIQSVSARYFAEMSKLFNEKDRLIDKEVDKVLLDAFHVFRGKEEYSYEQDILEESLERLFSKKKARSKK